MPSRTGKTYSNVPGRKPLRIRAYASNILRTSMSAFRATIRVDNSDPDFTQFRRGRVSN